MGRFSIVAIAVMTAIGCSDPAPPPAPSAPQPVESSPPASQPAANPDRNAYFGDLHVHTRYSFDAFIFGVRATPDDAYRFAKGDGIAHPAGFEIKLRAPLDFQSVTDHAMFLGMMPASADPTSPVSKIPAMKAFADAKTAAERSAAFQGILPYLDGTRHGEILDMNVVKSAWADIVASAERHNDPGKFTTFVAYEYTSGPQSQNLHRNVVFRSGAAPEIPFSRLDSQNPEALWDWMDA